MSMQWLVCGTHTANDQQAYIIIIITYVLSIEAESRQVNGKMTGLGRV